MSKSKIDPSEISIRQARREDVQRVASLVMLGSATQTVTEQDAAAEAAHPDYERAFDEVLASPDTTLFVAERAGEVVGTFQVTLIPGFAARGRKRAKFESVHVAPETRGMGIGAVMMTLGLAFAKEKGAGLVELTSHKARTDAHRFYRNLGFDQSHEGFKKLV
ncbi:GNAT family N-acetyltransferase [Bosea sp. BIWAKO-01]|uniref:GNAT family N-acetyltransferase n=1 Tax=Bosea sp. BIWAKO-01 TaxID=506668 RepID=UPI0008538965|nr:GNAT family N-acetyltransferase [Bosea sp. BIWAKO-01]GAU85198.1 regulatory protein for C-P lyase [Bosea sp. BIWAKO-01]